jgi:hypothetical protein
MGFPKPQQVCYPRRSQRIVRIYSSTMQALAHAMLFSPVTFFDDLAANMSDHNVSLVIYSGNDDSLVAHWSSEGSVRVYSRPSSVLTCV